MTQRIFDTNSYVKDFYATVLKCEKCESGFRILLDRTAFFPEGGGQKSDTGYLDDIAVSDVQDEHGEIYHYTVESITEGKCVFGSIDWEKRFCRMQNHTAEHILSGLANTKYGCRNIGFHLGDGFVTMDYDRMLTEKEISELEQSANKAVTANITVHAWYPDSLENITYRSKLDLKENVRIVDIKGIDTCACCAPHVSSTGEIGIIKILKYEKNRGGIRLTAKCGRWALDEFDKYMKQTNMIAALVSLPAEEAVNGVQRLLELLKETKYELTQFRSKSVTDEVRSKNDSFIFVSDPELLKVGANALYEKFPQNTVGAFCGDDVSGYRYMVLSHDTEKLKAEMFPYLSASGGGRDGMLQGMAHTDREHIEEFFKKRTNQE